MSESKRCCICGDVLDGQGNDATPVKDSGVCCDTCHVRVVVPRKKEQKENADKKN
jgi:hypothetical protein